MRCDVFSARGGVVIVCRSGRRKAPPCYRCNASAHLQCDHVVGKRDAGVAVMPVTCDRWCCEGCAVQVGPNKHHCRGHFDQAGKAAREVSA